MAITFGTEEVFNNAVSVLIRSDRISDTSFVVAYKDDGGDDYCIVKVGTISGTTISFGSEYEFNTEATTALDIRVLDSTHIIVASNDKVKIGTISGTSISWGTEYDFDDGTSVGNVCISVLDSTHASISWGQSFDAHSKIATISGTTISLGAIVNFTAGIGYTGGMKSIALDSTHFAISYLDTNDSNYGKIIIGTVSGTTITFGSSYTFNGSATYNVAIGKIDSTHVLLAYRDGNYGASIIGTISNDDEVAFGSEYNFNYPFTTYDISIGLFSSSSFIMSYTDAGNSSKGTYITGTIASVNEISFGDEGIYNNGITTDSSISMLTSELFCISYKDSSNSGYGTSIIGTTAEVTTTDNSIFFGMNF